MRRQIILFIMREIESGAIGGEGGFGNPAFAGVLCRKPGRFELIFISLSDRGADATLSASDFVVVSEGRPFQQRRLFQIF